MANTNPLPAHDHLASRGRRGTSRMAGKALLVGVILLALYSAFLAYYRSEISIPQNITQDNTIKAQDFIFSPPGKYPVVILGSSLSAKLKREALPPEVYSLGFRGQSVFEGFEILKRSNQVPKVILVEMNVLDRAPSRSTVDNLFHPAAHPLRGLFPAFRERNQPLNQAFSLGFDLIEKTSPENVEAIRQKLGVAPKNGGDAAGKQPEDLEEAQSNAQTDALREKIVQEMAADYGKAPAKEAFNRNFVLLRKYVGEFEKKGSQIVFFQMPIHPVACGSVRYQAIRGRMERAFPKHKYTYLPDPDCAAFSTSDGQHLTDASAYRYTRVLVGEINSMK